MGSASLGIALVLVVTSQMDELKPFSQHIPGSKVSFDLVPIPAGTFLMGSLASESDRKSDEGPQHPVRLPAFWMGKCEVTWDEVGEYLISTDQPTPRRVESPSMRADAITRPTPPYIDETFGYGRDKMPVIAVNQHFAMEYCRWLSRKTGRLYRLPTEAEWEYACKAGTTTRFSFGDGEGQLSDHAWFAANSQETPHPVGTRKPNPWGLHDMHGNVAEWCLDHYLSDGYARFPNNRLTEQPLVSPTEKRYSHVARGGAWTDPAKMLRSSARRGSSPKWNELDPGKPGSIWWLSNAEFVGFRVVAPVDQTANQTMVRSARDQKTP